jgi:hypothetical protein
MRRLRLRGASTLAMIITVLMVSSGAFIRGAGAQTQARSAAQAPTEDRRSPALAFARTELFFGTATPEGAVSDEEFRAFLDDIVTPLFPDGLTLLKGDGQFKRADGVTIKEQSYVLILLYPIETLRESGRKIDRIRRLYKERFLQESVLRVDDPFSVWVSF